METRKFLLMTWFLALLYVKGCDTIKLLSLEIPGYADVGSSVTLRCHYDMEGKELYSVKWYKNNHELYRFMPTSFPQGKYFNVQGIKVDMNRSDSHQLTLSQLNSDCTGIYRCEVSAEAPSFSTVHSERELTVIEAPKDPPVIAGLRQRYRIGDTAAVNCTSSPSKPAVTLRWYINGQSVPEEHVRRYPNIPEAEGKVTSRIGLHLKIQESHFEDGKLLVRCTGTIMLRHHKATEEISLEDPLPKPVSDSTQLPSVIGDPNSGAITRLSWSIFLTHLILCLVILLQ